MSVALFKLSFHVLEKPVKRNAQSLKKKIPVYLIVNVHAMQISQILTDFPCLGSDLQLRSSTYI